MQSFNGIIFPDVSEFESYMPSHADGLRLPVLHRSGGPLYAWPLPTPSLAERLAAEFIVPRWLGPEEADRRRREENERLRKFYQDQQREREKREKAEFEKAKEADRAYWASRPI